MFSEMKSELSRTSPQPTALSSCKTEGKEYEVVVRRWILASIWVEGCLDEIPVVRSHEEGKSEEYYPGEPSGCFTRLLYPNEFPFYCQPN